MQLLKEFRRSMGISQEDMAKKVGVTFSYYAKVEQGQSQAGAGFMKRFKRVFPHVSTDIFFDERGDK